ncbi:isoprenyl transferase [bacterium]|nr:isoprenyl transferase [bacterium]
MEKTEAELLELIKPEHLPKHLAIIMDGNGRWAKKRALPRIAGHKEGIKSVRAVIEACRELGIKHLTLYTFSMENWQRPKKEIDTLMFLLSEYIDKELKNLNKNQIKFYILGDWESLYKEVQIKIRMAMEETRNNDRMVLNLALNYGGRQEITRAAKQIAIEVSKGNIDPEDIDNKLFASYLFTKEQPDPDLMIRTSGEMRLSNFLLWQLAYAEFWITETLWPDFTKKHLYEALVDYQKRDRRFGSL